MFICEKSEQSNGDNLQFSTLRDDDDSVKSEFVVSPTYIHCELGTFVKSTSSRRRRLDAMWT